MLKTTKKIVLTKILDTECTNQILNLKDVKIESYVTLKWSQTETLEKIMIEFQYYINEISRELDKKKSSFFIANWYGDILQYNICGKLIKSYKQIHYSKISSLITQNSYLFSSDIDGNLKQFDIKKLRLIKSFNNIIKSSIESIAAYKEYLFLASKTKIVLWSIDLSKVLKGFEIKFENDIHNIKVTED